MDFLAFINQNKGHKLLVDYKANIFNSTEDWAIEFNTCIYDEYKQLLGLVETHQINNIIKLN